MAYQGYYGLRIDCVLKGCLWRNEDVIVKAFLMPGTNIKIPDQVQNDGLM